MLMGLDGDVSHRPKVSSRRVPTQAIFWRPVAQASFPKTAAAPVTANCIDHADQPVDEMPMNPHQRRTTAGTHLSQRFLLEQEGVGFFA
jgi:hypothetical protein